MPKLLFLTILFVPALALAECGVERADGALNVLVGAKGGCFSREGFREAFLNDVHRELAAQAARESRTRVATRRRPPPSLQAPAQTGGRYYGQR